MPDFIRAYQERAAGSGKPGEPIRFIASTSDVARDGMIIEAEGWMLDNFHRNPVFLWAHGYWEPAIGRVINVEVKDRELIADVVFDQDDEFARKIESKYRSGVLNAVSVGFDIKEIAPAVGDNPIARATKAELLEISGVPVPADPGALAQLAGRDLRSMSRQLKQLADEADPEGADGSPAGHAATDPATTGSDPASPTSTTTSQRADDDATARLSWDDTAAAMVDLYRPYSLRPDSERRADYDRLVRAYGRHKKQFPEFKTTQELEAFDGDTLRGLFLEGEPERFPDRFAAMVSRAGAVLSQRNRNDLAKAAELITSVLERAQKEAEAAEGQDDERAAIAALRGIFGPAQKDGDS